MIDRDGRILEDHSSFYDPWTWLDDRVASGYAKLFEVSEQVIRTLAERMGHISWEQLVAETLAVGSPDTVADKIAEMQRLGVGEVLCWMNFGGLPQAHVRRSMELFAREVMPRFR